MPTNRPFESFISSTPQSKPNKAVSSAQMEGFLPIALTSENALPVDTSHIRKSAFRSPSFWESVSFAWQGFQYLACNEHNFKIHLVLAAMAILTAALFGFARWEWITLIACTGLMLCTEAFNTAIELLIDLIVGDVSHPLAGRIKDISAAACLMMATAMASVGAFLFLPHLMALFSH
jgi:undecaprenol kinase